MSLTPSLYRARVDIAAIDTAEDAQALRAVAESYRCDTRLVPVGCPAHLVEVLAGAASTAEILILAAHGDERGFLLPELAPQIAAEQPFNGALTPQLVRRHARLPGRLVISVGCYTGSPAMAGAFLSRGARAYIGPRSAPNGEAAVAFVAALLYAHLVRELALPAAVDNARELVADD